MKREFAFSAIKNPKNHGRKLKLNPLKWKQGMGTHLWAARIFLGLKEFREKGKKTKTHEVDKVVEIVKKTRYDQVDDPSSSFVTQRGLYTSEKQGLVDEPSMQIIILNTIESEPIEKFIENMKKLTQKLAIEFQQEEVFLELSEDNIRRITFSYGK